MLTPTPETLKMWILQDIAGFIYVALLLLTVGYLLYAACISLRDWIRTLKTKKYEKEDAPVEWILDYPGYALQEYTKKDETD